MGGATFYPVPKAIDMEMYTYPRMWKRNMLFLWSSLLLAGFQFSRFSLMVRQSTMKTGEYMDWGSEAAPKRVRLD
jgi:hypothetical protein